MMKFAAGLAAIVLSAVSAPAVQAQSFPDKPIELVCSTSPGSTAAMWCQLMAQVLAKPDVLGTPVNVVYKGAGSGNEAAVYVMSRPADGYTLLHASASFSGYMNLPTFSVKPDDLEFLVKVEKFIYGLAVRSDSKYKTFGDLVSAAKLAPGTIGIAGNKIGSIHHKHIISAFSAAGATVIHIPYQGSGDAMRDLLGGHVPAALGTIGQIMPHEKAGKIRTLVVLNETRSPALPDVPTIQELGYVYPISHQWQGIFLKKGTPDEVKAKLRAAFRKVVDSPEYAEYLKNSPHVEKAFEDDPEKLRESFQQELQSYRTFMQENGIL
ncbi:tripartite tricarboxylate transporter substrate binding protein [Ancylobacter sp. MQZ15Z-1]|uniref:Tripartite tricarboxylate transporter substrate binding protein n=1 Tax=Ancylobacter mangrovi TaxID=2972472 RepID=A0A9X2PM07_9HYPH|nr:tripartite tricarboxylate transporter substrate binding protein [Ancylobacter mangrovi]MCS0496303.1 tripartite tricarboxylate transporter substrate binding protein [Ancylobacter mangrovi]